MTWNNRIIRSRHVVTNSKKEVDIYGLYEVYYGEYGEQEMMWTREPLFGYFDDAEELIASLEMMLKDAKRFKDDILDMEELNKKYAGN